MSQTWIIKDNAPVDEASRTLNQTNIPFTSDNKRGTYISISDPSGSGAVLTYGNIGDVAGMDIGSGDTAFIWGKEAFKTLVFDAAPTGELLAWLQKNADKYDPEYLTRKSELTSVADAIRAKGGTSDPLIYPDGFVTAINNIQTSSGSGGATVKVTNVKNGNLTNIAFFKYWEFGSDPSDTNLMKSIAIEKGESVTVNNVFCISAQDTTYPRSYTGMANFGSSQYLFPYSDSAEYITDPVCLTGDTLITLADKTTKRIDQMQVGDKILSYDPHSMKITEDIVTYTDSADHKYHTEYDIWTFSDGYILKTVHRHRFYNIEQQAMVYMDEWKIGNHGITVDGKQIELLSHKKVYETIRHYTLFTKNQNYFANGVLSGNRYTLPMNIS